MWDGLHWEGVWLDLDPWDVVRLRTSSCFWNTPRKYEPHGELFFFLIKKSPLLFTEAVQFKPFVLAETLNACALIGLHLVAAGVDSETSSSCGVFSLELRGFQDSVVRGALCGKKMYPWNKIITMHNFGIA